MLLIQDETRHTWPSRYTQKARWGVHRKTVAAPIRRAGLMDAPVKREPAHIEHTLRACRTGEQAQTGLNRLSRGMQARQTQPCVAHEQ